MIKRNTYYDILLNFMIIALSFRLLCIIYLDFFLIYI